MSSSRRGGKEARGAAPGCDVRSRLPPQFAPHHMLASFLLVGHRRPSTARGSPRSIRAKRGSPPPYQQLVQLDGEAADPAVAFDPAASIRIGLLEISSERKKSSGGITSVLSDDGELAFTYNKYNGVIALEIGNGKAVQFPDHIVKT
uniref:Uncharacterized protein n=1 Tax=Oryza glumipatula TaxID=40148 RepID=A0A0E0A6G2_9ORYZ